MADAPKLLTEAEWRRLLAPYGAEEAVQYLGERGLIAPEPVDALEAAIEALDQMYWADDNTWGSREVIEAALKRGMELAQPPLTQKEFQDLFFEVIGLGVALTDNINRLHAALTERQP